jgi:hypothetical protein
VTGVPIRVPARPTLILMLLAPLITCCQGNRDAGRGERRDSAVGATQASRARADSLRRRSDSLAAVARARLTPLTVLPDRQAVCRLSSRDPVPPWATSNTAGIVSVTRTHDELSLIVADSVAPRNVRCERGWRVIKVRGPIPLDLIGIISGISGTLANAGISIFAFSTFDTDYVMVQHGHLDRAVYVLRQAKYPVLDQVPRDSARPLPVKPVDEGVTDPDFFLFRARVQTALARHDTAEILQIVAPGILNSFGGDGGRKEFREHWGLSTPEKSQLWGALGFVLALGGKFLEDSVFYAPYLMYGTSGDGFETLVVLGSNVTVHAEPAAASRVIETVSFEEVTKWRKKSTTGGWEPIRTSGGKTGWVLQRHLRSPIDYRAGFVRRQGRWWLTTLVAGD